MTMAVMLLVVCSAANAQNQRGQRGQRPDRERKEMTEEDKQKVAEQMAAEKKEFLNKKMMLTDEEAERFWPVYDLMQAELQEAHKVEMKATRSLHPKKGETFTDEEAARRVDEYIASLSLDNEIIARYNAQLKAILPIQKVAAYYAAEAQFRKKMAERITRRDGHGEGRGPAPDRQSGRGFGPDEPDRNGWD